MGLLIVRARIGFRYVCDDLRQAQIPAGKHRTLATKILLVLFGKKRPVCKETGLVKNMSLTNPLFACLAPHPEGDRGKPKDGGTEHDVTHRGFFQIPRQVENRWNNNAG